MLKTCNLCLVLLFTLKILVHTYINIKYKNNNGISGWTCLEKNLGLHPEHLAKNYFSTLFFKNFENVLNQGLKYAL